MRPARVVGVVVVRTSPSHARMLNYPPAEVGEKGTSPGTQKHTRVRAQLPGELHAFV